jgi:polyphosphate kinase
VLFDRSWYNRAGVERVMGFCTPEQTDAFLRDAPDFEALLIRDGIRLFKLFLVIGREMQLERFHERRHDPFKKWKVTDIDLAVAVDGNPRQRPAARAAGGNPRGSVGDEL